MRTKDDKKQEALFLATIKLVNEIGLQELVSTVLAAVIRKGRDSTIQQAVGYLAGIIPHKDPFARCTTAGELIALCRGKIYSIERLPDQDQPMIIVHFWETFRDFFGPELQFMDDTHYHPPLIVKPKKVTNNYDCGYHYVRIPTILGKFTEHSNAIDLETLNILNHFKWRLDPDTLAQEPECPFKQDTVEDIWTWDKYLLNLKRITSILQEEDHFYLAWQSDSRGRVYSHGYHVNFQGNDYQKALLKSASSEYVTR